METQVKAIQAGTDLVIATPGRLIDLRQRGDIDLSQIDVVVLDEADRMADMGFTPQVEWLLRHLVKAHQTMLFSATLDGDVDRLVRHELTDPVEHEVMSLTPTVTEMAHRFIQVHQMDKVKVVAKICSSAQRSLVFSRTKRGADRLTDALRREGVDARAIHGDLRQQMRERALRSFSQGRLPVLVATDVAARGLDVDDVDVVIHYDPPDDHKAYLHRSGRTARAGKEGLVVTLVLWNEQTEVERIQKRLGLSAPIVEMFSNDPRLTHLDSWEPTPISVA
jgi:superfamily II DNA/RNA helicase